MEPPMTSSERVQRLLITGPWGRVGTHLTPLLREHFQLRLFDCNEGPHAPDDEVVIGDIQDAQALSNASSGADAMLHLAAVPDEDDFLTRLLPVNVVGSFNAFEAARLAGVRKMIFASTVQTVLNYGEGVWVTPDMPVRPYTVYACTKVFGEALARHYADKHGMAIIVIRIAWFQGYNSPLLRSRPDLLRHWCSPRDLAQLIVKSIHSEVQFATFFGVSNNDGRFWDISNAEKSVGYTPEDNASNLDQAQ